MEKLKVYVVTVEATNNILYGNSDFYDMLCNRIDDELF